MTKTFLLFEEIEEDLGKNAPSTVYKYRTWKDNNHKNLLTHQQVWFSHPFDLNDPLDVRPETIFDVKEFQDEKYLLKLQNSVPDDNPPVKTQEQRLAEAQMEWEYTKKNPQVIVQRHKEYNADREHFNPYGVFSTGINPLSEKTWKEYAGDHAGYCLGFKTVELCGR